ncbi:ABC transporter substrate-binding protein [Lysinibacillus odysseyi]|uniref:Sugar ABC transporter substrate-binding protein n=1 Tax=Lysinibacillus odysseyi 34hs-1 = NBRC 100172 TaxID=1220589 RepID=A0A0A3INF3_9BACI|nr:extracellular solute-binding protein [Lysinibacillus odysseyi]KGR85005.1 sugar ABC transporter substrate-binding protein [Lysinibacillus odysseyi 34hs-1 = NBRC 100172]
MLKRKHLALGMTAILSISALVGCSDSKDESNKGDTIELKVMLTPQWKGVIDAAEEGADYDSFFKYAAEQFEAEHKNVDISVEVVAGDQRDELLNVNLNGGTPPDVFFESVFAMGDYAHRGALVPLNDIIDDEAKADIEQGYWDSVTFGDDIYFYPFSHNPGTFTYNADMFKAAGLDQYIGEENEIKTWTMEEYEEILKTLKEKLPSTDYSNANAMGMYALNNQGDTWNLAYLRMFGNEFFDEEGNIILDDASGVKAAEWMNNVYQSGYTNPGAESVSSNDVNALFQNQQLAISFTNPILFNNAKADMEAGKMAKFDMRLANIPSESGDPLTFTYVTGAAVFDTKDEERIEMSKEFVKFVSTDEELIKASKNGIPVRTSVSELYKSENPLFAAYAQNSQYIFNFTGNVPGYSQLRQVLYPELQAMFTEQLTPEEAVKNYQEKGNQVINDAKEDSVIFNK